MQQYNRDKLAAGRTTKLCLSKGVREWSRNDLHKMNPRYPSTKLRHVSDMPAGKPIEARAQWMAAVLPILRTYLALVNLAPV